MKHLPFTETPIHELHYYSKLCGSKIMVKRDDLFLKAGGGNKARMLQYILADIPTSDFQIIVTAGGPNSNFNRACALMCAELGIQMHLVEYTEDPDEFNNSLNYYICKLCNIRTTRCQKDNVRQTINGVLNQYAQQNIKTKFIYGGGKSLEGIYAYYEAIKELKQQNINIDHLFIACGTGTTLTGVCAGMQKYYPCAKIHAISTARNWETESIVIKEDLDTINKYLNTSYNFNNTMFYENFLCGGYGKYNSSIIKDIKKCIEKTGMMIDPTYSGKAFSGMLNIISSSNKFKGTNILFWNTGGMLNLLSIHIDR